MTRRERLTGAAVLALVVCLLALVGEMDYQDAARQERLYCEMTKAGHWPAYDPRIDCDHMRERRMLPRNPAAQA